MSFEAIILGMLFLLANLYLLLTFVVQSHLIDDIRRNRIEVSTIWWPFYKDHFDNAGKIICNYGFFILGAGGVLFITWLLLYGV